MSHNTWLHRTVRPVVRSLACTRVSPNQLTTLRVVTGLTAAWCFATGRPAWAAGWWVLSALLDRADGELARLAHRSSHFGYLYDLGSDAVITALLFLGIGIGLSHGDMGEFALLAGIAASTSIAVIFLTIHLTPELRSKLDGLDAVVDPDDATLIIAPMAWFGYMEELLIAAAIVAPLLLVVLLARFQPPFRHPGSRRTR